MWGDPQFWTSLLCSLGVGGYQAHLARKANKLQEQIMRGEAPEPKTIVVKRGYHWFVILILMMSCWVPYLLSSLRLPDVQEEDIAYLKYYGPLAPPGSDFRKNPFLKAETKGELFRQYRNSYYLAAVAFHQFGVDIPDVPHLQKSGSYDIKDGRISMAIQLDQQFLNAIAQGAVNTNYALLLVPEKVRMNQFDTLRQATALGVRVMQISSGPP
jgi:hypothetical protein